MTARSKTLHALRTDEEVALSIRQALRMDNDVPDEKIKVQVHDAVATLEGSVDNDLQKETAEADARRIRGVRAVVNRIEV
jgi:osmotically-inducible protein OsmY